MKLLSLSLSLMLSSLGIGVLASLNQPLPSKRKTIILLLGPPGSGKGTQAATLTKDLNIPHISTGDLFRENMRNNTPLGQKAKAYIEAGKLVPDEVVLDMLFKRIEEDDCSSAFLLDGFPRTIPQAEALADYLGDNTQMIVINLIVPDEVITKRAEGRLTCRNCGSSFNKYFSPPIQNDKCDHCQGELYQRADDALEVVQERLRVYYNQSNPLVDYYQSKGNLINIDGVGEKDTIYKEIKKHVNL